LVHKMATVADGEGILDEEDTRSSSSCADLHVVANLEKTVTTKRLVKDRSPVPIFMATELSPVKPSKRWGTSLHLQRSESCAVQTTLRLDELPRHLVVPRSGRRVYGS
jgi:hypothetical protein